MPRSNSNSEFAERINWPVWLWLFLAMMIASIYLTFWAPFGNLVAAIKLRGQNADPAAFNATRFWVSTGVKVELKDKNDPTPYWLIATRKPKKLEAVLD
jgi:hypothetical protein